MLTLESVDGGIVNIADYQGRVVVLHAFASFATTSHTDVEQLSALYEQRPRDVEVIGISFDQDRKFIRPWRHAVGAAYVVVLASDEVRMGHTALGKISEVPVTIVLDRRGRVARTIARPLRPGELDPIVSKLLAE